VAIEYRWAEGQNNRLPVFAAELVPRQVKMIVAGGATPCAVAAKAATVTIPIIVEVAVDPIAIGLVASLDGPGGNVTGVTNLNGEIGPKRLELMQGWPFHKRCLPPPTKLLNKGADRFHKLC